MNEIEKARRIFKRLDWMYENYHGCDWCCGGGDEEKERLNEELKALNLSDETLKQIADEVAAQDTTGEV